MSQIFFAHAEEDFALVKTLVRALEKDGFACWHYERDTRAVQSYLAQIHEAVCATSLVVVIVSESSLRSHPTCTPPGLKKRT